MVGGEYSSGAKEIAGLSHGLSGAMGAATAADVKGENKGLAAVGAPALTEGGQSGYGGSAQMGVEDYRGGTLGSQLLSGEGAAESFGIAGMTAAQTLQATQTAEAGLMTAMHDIRSNQAKAIDALAAGRPDLYHTFLNDAKDAQIKALTFAQGILAQQQAGTIKPITKMVGGNLRQWNPTTRTWDLAVKGNAAAVAAAKVKAAAAKAALPSSALSKIYGHVVDSRGTAILKNGQIQPIAKSVDAAKVNLPLSRALHKWVDINGHPIPSLNVAGQPKPPPVFKPSTGKKGGGPTQSELNTGAGFIREHQLLLRAKQKLDTYNKRQIAAGVERSKGVKWEDNPMTLEQVGSLEPKWLADMGITAAEARAAEDPHTLQEVYLDIVHATGDARRAWTMMRKVWPTFGQGYFT